MAAVGSLKGFLFINFGIDQCVFCTRLDLCNPCHNFRTLIFGALKLRALGLMFSAWDASF